MSLNFYCQKEEYNNRKESINKYENIFSNYENNPPSLKEALIQMYSSLNLEDNITIELAEEILFNCKKRIDSEYDKINKIYENITLEDAYIICSYTYECENKEYSPYRLLNINLYSDNIQIWYFKYIKIFIYIIKIITKITKVLSRKKIFVKKSIICSKCIKRNTIYIR